MNNNSSNVHGGVKIFKDVNIKAEPEPNDDPHELIESKENINSTILDSKLPVNLYKNELVKDELKRNLYENITINYPFKQQSDTRDKNIPTPIKLIPK